MPGLLKWAISGIQSSLISGRHGAVAQSFGILRSDGTAERALIFIDYTGVIQHIIVSDINERPPLEDIAAQLARFPKP